jgi:signal peptidase I
MTHVDRGASNTDTQLRDRGGRRKTKSRPWVIFVRDTVLILVAAIVISVGIKAFLIRSFYIPSESMQDTLQVNDRIIVNELVPDMIAVKHGDVVVFRDPGGWLPASPVVQQNPLSAAVDWALSVVGLSAPDSNDHLIKRVIGLPGDKVTCCNAFGQISVNGVPISEPYVKLPAGTSKVSAIDFSVTVPADSYWVMGDNRYNSRDSRYNTDGPTKGFVPKSDIVGRAFVITWPSSHWTWLDDYPSVFGGVTK